MSNDLEGAIRPEIKSASIYVISASLNQLAYFFLIPFFWQKLTLEDYGVIAITEIISAFVGMFYGLSLDTSISRFYYEWPENERRRKVGAIWTVHWTSTVVLGVLSIAVMSVLTPYIFAGISFYPYVLFGIISTMCASMANLTFTTIRIKMMPVFYAVYNLASFLIRVSLGILFVVVLDKRLYGYFIANVASGLIVVFSCAVIMLFFATPGLRNTGIRQSLRFSLPLIGYSVTSTLSSVADRFMLQYFASLEVLGVYAVSVKFANVIGNLHSALKMSYVPFLFKTATEDKENGIQIISRMNIIYIIPIFAAGLVISMFIREFVYLVNREQYQQVISVVPFVMGPAIISTFFVYFSPGLLLANKTHLMWIPSAVQILVLFAIGPLLIKYYQLYGIIACNYLTTSSYAVTSYFMSQKYYYIPTKIYMLTAIIISYISFVLVASFIDYGDLLMSIVAKAVILAIGALLLWNYVFSNRARAPLGKLVG